MRSQGKLPSLGRKNSWLHRDDRTLDTTYGVCRLWYHHGTPIGAISLRTSPINRTRNLNGGQNKTVVGVKGQYSSTTTADTAQRP